MMRFSSGGRPSWLWPVLIALLVFVSISAATSWTWYVLDQRETRESQQRFALDAKALVQQVRARMQAYEIVLRGMSSTFSANDADVSPAQWNDIVRQMRVHTTYPGISSVAWAQYVPRGRLDAFVARVRAATRSNFHVFPEGEREAYLPIEYIYPVSQRTSSVIGLDLLEQRPQASAVRKAIDLGHAVLTRPLVLYVDTTSPEPVASMGLLMYLPVYATDEVPLTAQERRASFIGMSNAAFRGEELARGIFGAQLQLFHVLVTDVEVDATLFDSRYAQSISAPPDWKPVFYEQLELTQYGRTWRLGITGTPQYEQGLLTRNQDFVLGIGISTAFLLALLAGGFSYQRDRQVYAGEQVAQRLREQARQLVLANRYKSEFLANMSHELRTPLNSILILSDQLRQNVAGNLDERQARHADIVYRAGNDLLLLINDVLDLAKIEAGRMQMHMEPMNMRDLLVDLDASMRPLAEAKGLSLYIPALTADSDVPLRVFSDRVRLHQILRNLLSNAIKFTDAGQVRLAVSAHTPRADGSVVVRFAVHDTGIGIAPERQAQVFEAFQQLDGSSRRRFGGTGLGLAITRQLLLALDGDIHLESALGQGSTFTVNLPMRVLPDRQDEQTQDPVREGSGPAILVVEDDTTFAAVILEQARLHGFASVHCVNGQQALDLLKSESFVAVILDILLPDVSGWQLFRRMRTLSTHRHTPVHIISCLPQPEGVTQEQDTHYLTKPIETRVLEQLFSHLEQDVPKPGEPTLLLVEDVELEREYYQQQLSALGFAVTACATGQAARLLWEERPFDVLVVDLNLPDGDGFTLLDSLEVLRSLHSTRVVINTGVDMTRAGLQRLRNYSAVVVHKQGSDTAELEQAVLGFLGQVGLGVGDVQALRPPDAASADAPVTTLKGRRVLLVDDDVRNVYAMSAILATLGIEVRTADNGEAAIGSFRTDAPDLILMDMSMPVMDGYAATHMLKTECGCTIPIIALTAHAMKGDREKCLAVGADDYLAKPVQKEELRAMLTRWLVERPGQSSPAAGRANTAPSS